MQEQNIEGKEEQQQAAKLAPAQSNIQNEKFQKSFLGQNGGFGVNFGYGYNSHEPYPSQTASNNTFTEAAQKHFGEYALQSKAQELYTTLMMLEASIWETCQEYQALNQMVVGLSEGDRRMFQMAPGIIDGMSQIQSMQGHNNCYSIDGEACAIASAALSACNGDFMTAWIAILNQARKVLHSEHLKLYQAYYTTQQQIAQLQIPNDHFMFQQQMQNNPTEQMMSQGLGGFLDQLEEPIEIGEEMGINQLNQIQTCRDSPQESTASLVNAKTEDCKQSINNTNNGKNNNENSTGFNRQLGNNTENNNISNNNNNNNNIVGGGGGGGGDNIQNGSFSLDNSLPPMSSMGNEMCCDPLMNEIDIDKMFSTFDPVETHT